jgi:hypothetical protein
VAQALQFTLNLTGPQLVQNGSFATGDFTSWTLTGSSDTNANYVGSATSLEFITGFGRHTTTTYYGSYYLLTTNTHAAFLGESGALAYLSQTLTTVSGQPYLLSFWLVNPGKAAAINRESLTPNEFTASWNGNTLFNQTDMGVFSYTNLQFIVWATGASTTLEFGARNDNDYFGLDDVSVTPIPSPVFQSAAMAGGSLTLTWSAVAGATYQLQYTTNLNLLNWTNLGAPITAVSGAIVTSDANGAQPQRFYRVVLTP